MEYIDSLGLGKLVEGRVKWSLDSGLLVFDGEDYLLTSRAQTDFTNFYRWLIGCSGKLKPVDGREGKTDFVELFSGM